MGGYRLLAQTIEKLSDDKYKQWYSVYSKNKSKGKAAAARIAWGAIKNRNESMKLKDFFLIREEFPGMREKQDPRSQAISGQMINLIRNTDFDNNEQVEFLRTTLESIFDQLR